MDPIYGMVKIEEPVLVDLIRMPIIQRLRHVSMHGVPDRYYFRRHPNRYDHSLGVMIFLKLGGATLAQQVAGLLHEASSSAFAHIIEWAARQGLPGGEILNEDRYFQYYMRKQKIPEFLNKYYLDFEEIIDPTNNPLLTISKPDLSADVMDRLLREFDGWMVPGLAGRIYQSLYCHKGEIIFNSVAVARELLENYFRLMSDLWGTTEIMIRYYLFSQLLKSAFDKGVIKEDDFYRPEKNLLEIIYQSRQRDLTEIVDRINEDKIREKWVLVGHSLSRTIDYIDPKVVVQKRLMKLSQFDTLSSQMIRNFFTYFVREIEI